MMQKYLSRHTLKPNNKTNALMVPLLLLLPLLLWTTATAQLDEIPLAIIMIRNTFILFSIEDQQHRVKTMNFNTQTLYLILIVWVTHIECTIAILVHNNQLRDTCNPAIMSLDMKMNVPSKSNALEVLHVEPSPKSQWKDAMPSPSGSYESRALNVITSPIKPIELVGQYGQWEPSPALCFDQWKRTSP